jgi:hypothetical protein
LNSFFATSLFRVGRPKEFFFISIRLGHWTSAGASFGGGGTLLLYKATLYGMTGTLLGFISVAAASLNRKWPDLMEVEQNEDFHP